jgi:hypothetical protein
MIVRMPNRIEESYCGGEVWDIRPQRIACICGNVAIETGRYV